MKYLYSGKQAKAIDFHAIHTVGMPGLVLMERAAMTAAAVIREREPEDARILAVCGAGNNGGDGVATARILCQMGYKAAVTVVGQSDHMTEDMKKQLEIAVGCHVPVLSTSSVTDGVFDVMLDAVFGVGLSRPVEGVYASVLEQMNGSGARIYALDIPSGVDGESGAILGRAVKADVTITFGVNKTGLVVYPGCACAGEVIVGDIGFPRESVESVPSSVYFYEPEDLARLLPARPPRSHKGTFGKVLVAAGCETMSGACFLAAKAAYRMGAGLVKVVSVPANRDVLLTALPEILFSDRDGLAEGVEWADAIVIGPGLGQSEEAEEMVRYVVENSPVPTVIDGDGIRLCRRITDTLTDNFVLTPHIKEMSDFTGISVRELQEDLVGHTRQSAEQTGCILVGKDARTVVSDGRECYINVSGNNGMATGGSGDVLAGTIGGLLGQGMEPFEAAKLGVYLHGLGGDVMASERGRYSLMASDILEGIARVTAEMEKPFATGGSRAEK